MNTAATNDGGYPGQGTGVFDFSNTQSPYLSQLGQHGLQSAPLDQGTRQKRKTRPCVRCINLKVKCEFMTDNSQICRRCGNGGHECIVMMKGIYQWQPKRGRMTNKTLLQASGIEGPPAMTLPVSLGRLATNVADEHSSTVTSLINSGLSDVNNKTSSPKASPENPAEQEGVVVQVEVGGVEMEESDGIPGERDLTTHDVVSLLPTQSISHSLTYEEQLNRLLSGLRSFDLADDIYDQTEFYNAHGGYCDVFKAKSKRHNGMDVAVKRLRVHVFHDKDVSKAFGNQMIFRELKLWSELHHPNVLPLLGYVMHGQYPATVSKWMINGTLRTYMENNSQVPVMQIAMGIASGLAYLHDRDIIHSDLKRDNILMSDSGEPLLADFGISRIMTSTSVTTVTSLKGSTRWMAIELWPSTLSEEDTERKHTKQTDIWAFGMVMYELLTGFVPFHEIKNDVRVSFVIAHGQIPSCPALYTDLKPSERLLWTICVHCWKSEPSDRPEIEWVREQLSTGAEVFTAIH